MIYAGRKLDVIEVGSGGTILNQLANQNWMAEVVDYVERGAGHVSPQFAAALSAKPAVRFTTSQLATLLVDMEVGCAGKALSNLRCFLGAVSQTATGKVARATSGHERIIVTNSVAYWENLTLPHKGTSQLAVNVAAVWDGTNEPFIYTGTSALPAGGMASGEHFVAGPCKLNGTWIDGVQEISVQSAAELIREGSDGELYDTLCAIDANDPIITIRTFEAVNWGTVLLPGLKLVTADGGFIAYGRKLKQDLSREADNATVHLKMSVPYGRAVPVDTTGQSRGLVTDTLRIVCRTDPAQSGPETIQPITFTRAAIA